MSFLSRLFFGEGEKPLPAEVVTQDAPRRESAGAGELLAVIMAAIAAYEGGGAVADSLIVRSIKRAPDQMPAWGRAGLSDCMDSRRL